MVQVSADAFLAKVTELYEQTTSASNGSVAISCKSGMVIMNPSLSLSI